LYDLLIRVVLLIIFISSVIIILYPLAKKIPEQLFINPINRFIDLISNNQSRNDFSMESLPIELALLETKILGLLKTATEHERNKANIELGHLSARLVHDIRSPLSAMEMNIRLLSKTISPNELAILKNGIQSVRDIADNVLERYRNPHNDPPYQEDENSAQPILLPTLIELIISQKQHEWDSNPVKLTFTIQSEAKTSWVTASPNEIKRILSNLLNNAYDAISDKIRGNIQIALNKINRTLYLYIQDNGTGIPHERIADVLCGVSLKHKGKGLGLSAAHHYMKKLVGGNLEINSSLGIGTKITLIFPQTKRCFAYTKKPLS